MISQPRNGAVRLLTLICFFNFFGFNNGYTYIQNISPVAPSSSISSIGDLVQNLNRFLFPADVVSTIKNSLLLINGLAVKMQSTICSAIAPKHSQKQRADFIRDSALKTGTLNFILTDQIKTLKWEKETWHRLKKQSAQPPQGLLFLSKFRVPISEQNDPGLFSNPDPQTDADRILTLLCRRLHYSSEPDADHSLKSRVKPEKSAVTAADFFIAQKAVR